MLDNVYIEIVEMKRSECVFPASLVPWQDALLHSLVQSSVAAVALFFESASMMATLDQCGFDASVGHPHGLA